MGFEPVPSIVGEKKRKKSQRWGLNLCLLEKKKESPQWGLNLCIVLSEKNEKKSQRWGLNLCLLEKIKRKPPVGFEPVPSTVGEKQKKKANGGV